MKHKAKHLIFKKKFLYYTLAIYEFKFTLQFFSSKSFEVKIVNTCIMNISVYYHKIIITQYILKTIFV